MKRIITKRPDGQVRCVRYECKKSEYNPEVFKKLDKSLSGGKDFVEVYKGMNVVETAEKVSVSFDFE